VMGLVSADVTPRPLAAQSGRAGNERPIVDSDAVAPLLNRGSK
jgi:hypothetical protein